jgi:hypothetical protein
MPSDKTYQNVQLYINFNKEVTGTTKQPASVLYSNLDPTGATNMAIEMAKIYSWVNDVFTFTPTGTNKISIKDTVLPSSFDTKYQFREGTIDGAFQVQEDDEAWQTISIHGVPTIDANGKILETFLPSYVDDVVEGYYYDGKFYTSSAHTTEITAETGKIYVDVPSNVTYRYGGTTYVPITNPVDIMTGATSSTAGVAGLVPAPPAGAQGKFLRGDGTWETVVTSDIKARQAIDTSNKNYPLLFSYAETSSTTTNIDNTTRRNNSIYVNPSTGTVTATNFAGKINNHTVNADVPSNPVFTDTKYTLSGTTYDTNNTAQIVTLTPSSGTATTATIAAMTGASSSAAGKAGLVPKPAAGDQSKFLRADGTWVVPTNTDTKVTQNISSDTTGKTYPLIFSYYEVGSTTATAQTVSRKDTIYATPKDGSITATNFIGNINGFDFPTPASGDSTKYLRGDGTWAVPTNTTYALSCAYGSGNKTWVSTLTANGSTAAGTSTVPTASTSVYGITSLSSATNSSAEDVAATPKAVKSAYDLAAGKSTVTVSNLKTSGTKIATITIDGTGKDVYVQNMTASTASAAGTRGTVQAPANSMDKYLRGDNTWVEPVEDFRTKVNNETYTLVLHCTNGRT